MEKKDYLVEVSMSDGREPEGMIVSDTDTCSAAGQVLAQQGCDGMTIFVSSIDTSTECAFYRQVEGALQSF